MDKGVELGNEDVLVEDGEASLFYLHIEGVHERTDSFQLTVKVGRCQFAHDRVHEFDDFQFIFVVIVGAEGKNGMGVVLW